MVNDSNLNRLRVPENRKLLMKFLVVFLLLFSFMLFGNQTRAEATEIQLPVQSGQDISEVLQSAVKQYDSVIIPEGEYYCSGVKLNGKNGLKINATGATITQSGSENPILLTSNGTTASNITIVGGTWKGAQKDVPIMRFYGNVNTITLKNVNVLDSANAGLRFKDSQNVTLTKVKSASNVGYGVIFENVNNITINNSKFLKSSSGINFLNCDGDILISGSAADENKDNGLLVSGATNITVKESEFNNNNIGMRISGVGQRVALSTVDAKENTKFGIRIYDNTGEVAYSHIYAYDNGGTGVSMENCSGGVSLYKSNAKRNQDCGFTLVKCSNVKVNSCNSSKNTGYGYNFDGCFVNDNRKYCVNMKNSVASTNDKIGIRVVNCAQSNIQETTTEKNKDAGVYSSSCENVTLNQVTSDSNSSNGASLNSTQIVKAANNNFNGNQANGLRVNGCTTIWVTNGEYHNNKEAGVTLQNVEKLSVKGAKFYANTGYGLNVDTVQESGLVKNVESYSNGNIGLRYKSVSGKINTQSSNVYDNQGSGIYGVECANMVVNGSYIYSNAQFGVNASDCELANVKYCEAYSNSDIGIRYSGCTKVIVTDSKAYSNVNAGIYAGDCKTITFNLADAYENQGFGINVNNGTAVSTVSSQATGNSDAGLRYNQCKRVKVSECYSGGNSTGIIGADIKSYFVADNTLVQKNTGYGVNLSNVKGSCLTKVSAYESELSGVFVSDKSNVVLEECDCSRNGAHGIYVVDSAFTINNSQVDTNYWCGLSATGTQADVTVNSSTFTGNGTRPDQYEDDDNLCAGIGIYGGATARVNESECRENHGCGITAAGAEDGSAISTIEVCGCVASSNGDHGIGARPYGKINVSASNNGTTNTIDNNKHSGFIINDHCTSDYVKDCSIYENGKHGISVSEYSSLSLAENNSIYSNGEDGVHVSDNSSLNIKSCQITKNTLSGIGVYSNSNFSGDNCQILENLHYGICVDTSQAPSINNCGIGANEWAGVIVRNGGVISSLKDCGISDNKTYGLYCSEGGSFVASGVSLYSNEKDGIRITGNGSTGQVSNVDTSGNQQNGFVVTDGASVSSMVDLTLKNNTKNGFAIYKNSSTDVISGKFEAEGNGNYQVYVEKGANTSLVTR